MARRARPGESPHRCAQLREQEIALVAGSLLTYRVMRRSGILELELQLAHAGAVLLASLRIEQVTSVSLDAKPLV